MIRNLLLFCFLCLTLNSCTSYIDDYVIVKQVYFFDEKIITSFNGMNEIKFAMPFMPDSLHRLYICNINVKKGSISFFYEGGKVEFLPNNKLKIESKIRGDSNVFELYENHLYMVWFSNSSYPYFEIAIKTGDKYQYRKSFKYFLEYKTKNKHWLITIPIKISHDFEGDTGCLEITPNYFWYDF